MNKRELLAAPPPEKVTIEGVGELHIRQLTGVEFEQIQKLVEQNKDKEYENVLELVIRTVCTETGEPMFQEQDRERLRALPVRRLLKIGAACNEANGFANTADDLTGKSATIT